MWAYSEHEMSFPYQLSNCISKEIQDSGPHWWDHDGLTNTGRQAPGFDAPVLLDLR